MFKRIEKHIIFYSFSVILVIIVCICSNAFSFVYAEKAPVSSEKALIKVSRPSLNPPFLQPPYSLSPHLASMSIKFLSINPNSIVFISSIIVELDKSKESVPHKMVSAITKEIAKVVQYEVIADSLNVRSAASASSKIIKVTNKGDLLNALKPPSNGWMAIEGGGYVNIKYIKLISGSIKPIAKVTILSKKPIAEVPLKPSFTIKSDSGLLEADIKEIFKGTSLAGFGLEKAILNIEEEYGINAYFTIAVMKLESGNGKSKIAKEKNNLFGLNAITGDKHNKAFSFKTKGESVQKFGQIISKSYINKGYTTVEKVSVKYCKANPEWPGLVKNIMNNDYKRL
jgi:hypothetical protein